MKMILMRSEPDGYSLDESEGYYPDELEWRIVEAADYHFPRMYQSFGYDSCNLPTLDIIDGGKVTAKIFFEKE